MEQLIPSKDVRMYLDKINYQFSDMEKATIIYNSGDGLYKIYEKLAELERTTKDIVLKQQIRERIEWDLHVINLIKINQGKCIYVLSIFEDRDDDYMDAGYYISFQSAEKAADQMSEKYVITKVKLYDETVEWQDNDTDPEIGAIYFDENGEIMNYWSEETDGDPKALNCVRNIGRFETNYIFFQHPFQRGDIIKNILTGEIGIIGVVPSYEAESMQYCDSEEKSLDMLLGYKEYSDTCIRVEMLQENNRFFHEHILPIYLEYANLKETDHRKTIMESASELLQGRGSIEEFQMYSMIQSEDKK